MKLNTGLTRYTLSARRHIGMAAGTCSFIDDARLDTQIDVAGDRR